MSVDRGGDVEKVATKRPERQVRIAEQRRSRLLNTGPLLLQRATHANDSRISGNLVGKYAGVAHDGLELAREALDVQHDLVQILIELGVVDQLTQRAVGLIERLAEGGELSEQLFEL